LSGSIDFALRPAMPVFDLMLISGISFFMLLTDRLMPYTFFTSFLSSLVLSSASGFLNVIDRSVVALKVLPSVFLFVTLINNLSFFRCQPSDNFNYVWRCLSKVALTTTVLLGILALSF
jgi:hypothetical protein